MSYRSRCWVILPILMQIPPSFKIVKTIMPLVIYGIVSAPAYALEDLNNDSFTGYADQEIAEPWRELSVTIPPFPNEKNLQQVPVPAINSMRLSLDKTSIDLAQDGVVRFVYIIESQTGVRNVFYDGIRCATREYKTYAFGDTDSKFVVLQDAQWHDLPYHENNTFRYTLSKHYICDKSYVPRSPRAILRAIRLQDDDT